MTSDTGKPAPYTPFFPDLVVGFPFYFDGSTFLFRVSNVGLNSSPASQTGVYLSADDTIDTADSLLAKLATPAFPRFDGSYDESLSLAPSLFAADLTPGLYYLGAIADIEGEVREISETDNASQYPFPIYLGNAQANALTGASSRDTIVGFAGNDRLDGGSNDDVLVGGAGNDTYIVDNIDDVVTERAGEGADTVFASTTYALGAGQSIELLATTLASGTAAVNLTGNELGQTIIGNAAANRLSGLGGADTMQGLGGNDTYSVDNAGDKVFEAPGGGTDTVYASVGYVLLAGQSVELLATASAAGTSALHLAGNTLAQAITGNAGANVLNDGGAGGADTMSGLGGNDSYVVANAGDQVVEAAGGGADTVFAAVSYALKAGQSIELLATSAASAVGPINLTGNELAQTINGNNGVNGLVGGAGDDTLNGLGGNDRLIGGAGHDVLDGGVGSDTMVFFAVSESSGAARDLVLDIALSGGDRLQFTVTPAAIDAEVAHGGLNAVHFDANLAAAVGAGQLAAHHAVLFDPDAGDLNLAGHLFLVVDANGVAGYQAGADYVVELQGATGALTIDDFV